MPSPPRFPMAWLYKNLGSTDILPNLVPVIFQSSRGLQSSSSPFWSTSMASKLGSKYLHRPAISSGTSAAQVMSGYVGLHFACLFIQASTSIPLLTSERGRLIHFLHCANRRPEGLYGNLFLCPHVTCLFPDCEETFIIRSLSHWQLFFA